MGPRQAHDAYYVAVSTRPAKLTTLVELLQALQSDSEGVALAVVCGSRDTLDEVVAALAACGTFALAVLHSDLTLPDIERQVAQLKERLQRQQQRHDDEQQQRRGARSEPQAQAAAGEAQPPGQGGQQQQRDVGRGEASGSAAGRGGGAAAQCGGGDEASGPAPRTSLVLVTTDVCLKVLPKELLPVGLPLLIQYDIPPTKEVFTRRMSAVFGGSKERRRGPLQRSVIIDFVVAGELPSFRTRERFSTTPVLEMPVHVPDIL